MSSSAWAGQVVLPGDVAALGHGGHGQHVHRADVQQPRLEGVEHGRIVLQRRGVDGGDLGGRAPPALPPLQVQGIPLAVGAHPVGARSGGVGVPLLGADDGEGQRVERRIPFFRVHGEEALPLRAHPRDRGDDLLPRALLRREDGLVGRHDVLRGQALSIVEEDALAQGDGVAGLRPGDAAGQPVLGLIAVVQAHQALVAELHEPLHGRGGVRKGVQLPGGRGHGHRQRRGFRLRGGRGCGRHGRHLRPVEGLLTLAGGCRHHQECTQAHQGKSLYISHGFSLPLLRILSHPCRE